MELLVGLKVDESRKLFDVSGAEDLERLCKQELVHDLGHSLFLHIGLAVDGEDLRVVHPRQNAFIVFQIFVL